MYTKYVNTVQGSVTFVTFQDHYYIATGWTFTICIWKLICIKEAITYLVGLI